MSGWDAYITNLMGSSGYIKKAAIAGVKDGGVWAKSSDFAGTPEELQKLIAAFDNLDDLPSVGFHLENTKFLVPRTFDNCFFGKKGKSGVWAYKSDTAVIIACFEGEADAGQECRASVEKLGKYLAGLGY